MLYDLRTATKCQVLEGHLKPITCLSFSFDGKLFVSFSVEEACLKLWIPLSGFFSIISTVCKPSKSLLINDPDLMIQASNVALVPNAISISFVTDKIVELKLNSIASRQFTFT